MTIREKELRDQYIAEINRSIEEYENIIEDREQSIQLHYNCIKICQKDLDDSREEIEALKNILRLFNNETEEES